MSKQIWKYELGTEVTELRMPAGAKVLTVQVQHAHKMLWAMVDPGAKPETRWFTVFGTGHPIEESTIIAYVGTVQEFGGGLIWHIFETKA